jgi:putative endonuclease
MYTLYILHSESIGKYYVGYTNDLPRRLTEYNRKKGKFTDVGIPWILVYSETFKSRKSRQFIEELISQE